MQGKNIFSFYPPILERPVEAPTGRSVFF